MLLCGLLSCNNSNESDKLGTVQKDSIPASNQETVAAQYQCPMKCEGETSYTRAGNCKVCGMALEKIN